MIDLKYPVELSAVAASDQVLARIAEILKAMADPTRLKVLHALQGGERCVSDILRVVGGSQANVSKHLSVLRKAGLVDCQRDGVNVRYRITDPGVFAICRNVCDSLELRLGREHRTLVNGRQAMERAERAGHGDPNRT